MKKETFLLILFVVFSIDLSAQNVFSVKGNQTLLNDQVFQSIGLRCSNALLSDETTDELVSQLDTYRQYGINSISVFFMGSRYSNINGYNLDGTLKDIYKERMSRIIEACDQREMVVLVGVLYWGAQQRHFSNAYYRDWKQPQVNAAISNTLSWLKSKNYRNIYVDPDNEGMAERGAGFNIDEMICKGKEVAPEIPIAYNGKGYAPPCADLAVHFCNISRDMPYIQTEGTPSQYWGDYSKEKGLDHYINVGIYTDGKKKEQIDDTRKLLDAGYGYYFASTWLQNVPPNYEAGGDGSPCNPGMKWWLEFIRDNYKK